MLALNVFLLSCVALAVIIGALVRWVALPLFRKVTVVCDKHDQEVEETEKYRAQAEEELKDLKLND